MRILFFILGFMKQWPINTFCKNYDELFLSPEMYLWVQHALIALRDTIDVTHFHTISEIFRKVWEKQKLTYEENDLLEQVLFHEGFLAKCREYLENLSWVWVDFQRVIMSRSKLTQGVDFLNWVFAEGWFEKIVDEFKNRVVELQNQKKWDRREKGLWLGWRRAV